MPDSSTIFEYLCSILSVLYVIILHKRFTADFVTGHC